MVFKFIGKQSLGKAIFCVAILALASAVVLSMHGRNGFQSKMACRTLVFCVNVSQCRAQTIFKELFDGDYMHAVVKSRSFAPLSSASSELRIEIEASSDDAVCRMTEECIREVQTFIRNANECYAQNSLAQLRNGIRKLQGKIDRGDKSHLTTERLSRAMTQLKISEKLVLENSIRISNVRIHGTK